MKPQVKILSDDVILRQLFVKILFNFQIEVNDKGSYEQDTEQSFTEGQDLKSFEFGIISTLAIAMWGPDLGYCNPNTFLFVGIQIFCWQRNRF